MAPKHHVTSSDGNTSKKRKAINVKVKLDIAEIYAIEMHYVLNYYFTIELTDLFLI